MSHEVSTGHVLYRKMAACAVTRHTTKHTTRRQQDRGMDYWYLTASRLTTADTVNHAIDLTSSQRE